MGRAAAIGVSGLVVATGSMCAAGFIAHAFNHQAILGAPLIPNTDLYAPWSAIDWTLRWGGAYPKVFAIAELIMGGGIIAAVAAALAMLRPNARVPPFGKDAWAAFEDAANGGLFAAGGTVLGKLRGEILCLDEPGHQLLIGASRSGKGRGHVVPTLLSWPGSALVLDVKGELDEGDVRHGFSGTSGFRAELGPILRFAPTRPGSNAFNPLLEVRRGANEVRDVQNIVEFDADVAATDMPPLFVITADGAEIVNYRVQGQRYMLDRIFETAELRLGTRAQTIVRIERDPYDAPARPRHYGPRS